MSATDKEPKPLGSTSGKRGYIRTCVRCGVTLYGVGRRAKYCPECRAEVNREMAMDYRTRNPEKVRAAYERKRRPPGHRCTVNAVAVRLTTPSRSKNGARTVKRRSRRSSPGSLTYAGTRRPRPQSN